MTTALDRLKKEFPDYRDWPDGAVEATVKMMQEYAEDVAQDALHRADENSFTAGYWDEGKKEPKIRGIISTEIITP